MKYIKSCNPTSVRDVIIESAEKTDFIAGGDSEDARYQVVYEFNLPIENTYIMIPSCAYNGNRFKTVVRKYAPMFTEEEFSLAENLIMTECPHLEKEGDSFMDVTTGDMAVPCVCLFNQKTREGCILFTNQGDHHLNHGISLDQKGDALFVTIAAPAKRRLVYRWYDFAPSLRPNPEADKSLSVKKGQKTTISHRMYAFPCESITDLFKVFFDLRHELYPSSASVCLPFSVYFSEKEKRLNEYHFIQDEGFYAATAHDGREIGRYNQWQAGWTGGGMITLPLMVDGCELSKKRAVENLLFAGRHQSKAGWFYGIVYKGENFHDCFGLYEGKYSLVLTRKQCDMVYFLYKQIAALESTGQAVPGELYSIARKAADAIVAIWKTYGQIGQFVNAETGEIKVGGSTSAAIAPAALCAASIITENPDYLTCAMEIADYFYKNYTQKGLTTGGPGEIMQAPDSESAFALVESNIVLYETTGEPRFLSYAKDAAHQAASWVVAYPYEFPKGSRLSNLGINAAGSVWANVQNKHSAPGICTLSASMLLKLFRATGDEKYLHLMRDISHFSPQVASSPLRPIEALFGYFMPPGDISERVNLSDWEGNEAIGDSIYNGSAWPEAALMLTYLEIPGIYLVPSRNLIAVSDHVEAKYVDNAQIEITNPTSYTASIKILTDTEETIKKPLSLFWQEKFMHVTLPPGQTIRISV